MHVGGTNSTPYLDQNVIIKMALPKAFSYAPPVNLARIGVITENS